MTKPAVIQLEHVYRHAPSVVWRALTDPTLHAQWWAPGDVRPIVGHEFDLDMGQWGKQPCVVIAVETDRLFSFRFATGSLDTIITWKLAPEGDGTRLTLTHEGFDLDSPMSRSAFEGMGSGWPGLLARLEKKLAGR